MSQLNEAIGHIFANHNASLEKKYRNDKKCAFKKKDLELAFAVVLVELASCDQNFDNSEYQIIIRGIQRLFGTSTQEVSRLVQQATQALGQMRGTARFASMLKESLPIEERQVAMSVIEDVIHADGLVDGFEVYLRHKFADLLGVPVPGAPTSEVA